MSMLRERLQILVSAEQRRRLEAEAKRRGTSVASLIREAVDVQYGAVTSADRMQALQEIAEMRGAFISPDDLDRLAETERDQQIDEVLSPQAS